MQRCFAPPRFVFCLLLVWMPLLKGCPRHPLHEIHAPQVAQKQRIRWLRTTFYQLYPREKEQPQDLLRLLILRFPAISLETYHANLQHIEEYKQKQKSFGNLEQFYLLMNLLIEESLPPPLQPKLQQLRQQARTKPP